MKILVFCLLTFNFSILYANEAFSPQYKCVDEENNIKHLVIGNRFSDELDFSNKLILASPQEYLRCPEYDSGIEFSINSNDNNGNISTDIAEMENSKYSLRLVDGKNLQLIDEISETYEELNCIKQDRVDPGTNCE